MHETMHRSRQIYKGRLVGLRVDEVTREDGSRSQREIVSHPGAVAIVAIPQKDHVILVQQYRYAVGRQLWELPAGLMEPEEEPAETAGRELEEETGYRAGSMVHLTTLYTSPGFCDEEIHLYRATALTPCTQRQPDPEERLHSRVFPLDEVRAMIKKGEIVDAKTVAAILALNALTS